MLSNWNQYVDDLQEELARLTALSEKNVNWEQAVLDETAKRLGEFLRAGQTREIANQLHSNLVGVLVVGEGPVLQYTNSRAREILGSKDQIQGVLGSDNEVFYLADQITPCAIHLPWLRALSGLIVDGDLIFYRPIVDSSDKWIKVCALPQREPGEDAISAAIVLIIDATEHVQAEHCLRATKQALQQSLLAAASANEAAAQLAVKLGATAEIGAAAGLVSKADSVEDGPTKAKKKLALVADDMQVNQLLLSSQLKRLGFAVHLVNNGKEAVEAAATTKFDIIFMDCAMPIMDGYMASKAIRDAEKQSNVHTPILAVTAFNRTSDREKCLAAGIDDYVPKGWDLVLLQKMIESLLKDHSDLKIDEQLLPGEGSDKDKDETAPLPSMPDINALEKLYGKENLNDILALFVTSAESSLDCIQAALTERDARGTHHFAYSLKGQSALLSAGKMATLCEKLAESAIRGKWFDADDHFTDLQSAFKAWRKSLPTSTFNGGKDDKDGEKSKAPASLLAVFEQQFGKQTALAMANAFKHDTKDIVEKMTACIKKRDNEELHGEAHKLKGCCASIFIANELRVLSKQLEYLCNEQHVDWTEVSKLFDRLSKSYSETAALMETYVKSNR
jgi:CheY-like chemotaxis protein/HPt (histidine-containing phosphotransfer) domain-containing protein